MFILISDIFSDKELPMLFILISKILVEEERYILQLLNWRPIISSVIILLSLQFLIHIILLLLQLLPC